ncbi:hypothetical protein K0U83_18710 [bacterium]|nr:hypothetical protein [bacterium]
MKSNPGGGPNFTAEHFAPPGDDSHPLATDYQYSAPTPQAGRYAALGYIDPLNTPVALPGDKRTYARDGDGAVVVALWLKNDGSAVLSNANGSVTLGTDGAILGQNGAGQFELQAGGDFVANGAKMTTDGDVVTSDGVSLRGHTHAQGDDSGGSVEVETDPPTV